MNAPRYFWAVLTVLAIAFSIAGMLSLRWVTTTDPHYVVDTWRGAICSANACASITRPVVDVTKDPFADLARTR